MFPFLALILAQEDHGEKSGSEALLPEINELIWGALAFTALFLVMTKLVFPRINRMLDARRQKIQGELERAEQERAEADRLLADYRAQLGDARQEANRIIEEARGTAESIRRDMISKAEQESQAVVARAQDEIRGERERTFQELRGQVGELSVELAARIVGDTLDKERQLRLVDEYITELASINAAGNGAAQPGHRAPGAEA